MAKNMLGDHNSFRDLFRLAALATLFEREENGLVGMIVRITTQTRGAVNAGMTRN